MEKKTVNYEILKEKGFNGLVEWYETLGIENEEGKLDPTKVRVCPETYKKMQNAIKEGELAMGNEKVNDETGLAITFMNYGPSGYHKDVPVDVYYISQQYECKFSECERVHGHCDSCRATRKIEE
jgi:hypothetical protein